MKRIYLDNAATSFPKAPGIAEPMASFLERDCLNPNRTESGRAFKLFEDVYRVRETLARLYGHDNPASVVFTRSVTESLNWVIKGLFTQEDHVIVTSSEHNAVMRPLVQCGIQFSRIPADKEGYSLLESVDSLVRSNTKAMIVNVCGNVSGHVEDVEAIACIARRHGLLLFVDSAQASPFVDLRMDRLDAAGICFTGHKGFLGPEGIGGMVLRTDIAQAMQPLIAGGTGSESDSEEIPHSLPDRLEAGTLNIPGILGLGRALEFVLGHKEELARNMQAMTVRLYEGLRKIDGVELVGPGLDPCFGTSALEANANANPDSNAGSNANANQDSNAGSDANANQDSNASSSSNATPSAGSTASSRENRKRTNVISIVSQKKDIAYISSQLLERCGIETRVGLHCSPAAHKTLGTFPGGTLRFSPGPFTTTLEIDETLECLKEIMDE